jgi:NitT/TauT family transport system substrate-binding protein/putative hydroxymethylpyrimidine transport system substrate-binding protein
LEQVPLGALISTEAIGITDPSQLEGGTIGVTGVPSDEAISRFVLEEAGADTSTVEFITIGFDAVGNLIGRTVDAAFGFWSAEAVALEGEGEAPVLFRPDQYGAPPYPELVFFAATESIEEDPLLFEAFADALARGYATALSDPEAAIDSLAALAPGIDTAFATAEFEKVSPHFMSPDGRYGAIDPDSFSRYLGWANQVGIIDSVPDDLLTTEFMP